MPLSKQSSKIHRHLHVPSLVSSDDSSKRIPTLEMRRLAIRATAGDRPSVLKAKKKSTHRNPHKHTAENFERIAMLREVLARLSFELRSTRPLPSGIRGKVTVPNPRWDPATCPLWSAQDSPCAKHSRGSCIAILYVHPRSAHYPQHDIHLTSTSRARKKEKP
jgi:hypothetical protein